MTKQEDKGMTEQLQKCRQKIIWVNQFDEEDWSQIMKCEPEGYSSRLEASLTGNEYIEQGREFLRSN
jgi:hypothetical protein